MKKPISDNFRGGLVTAPVLYLKNVKGIEEEYLLKESACEVSSVGKALCGHFNDPSNCTLTGVFNLLSFYRDVRGFSNIPDDSSELYRVIREVGDRHGYNYEREKGIPVYNNRRYLKAVLRAFGYPDVKVLAEFVVPMGKAIELLDNGSPFLLSIAYGVYFNHTVTVYGYETYRDTRTGRRYTFLLVNDEWSAAPRYIPWINMDRFKLICVTRIK
ncbi:MAG: hypothetical protein J5626_10740 [Lachnospiraceae bacterium]|nr:hypothetical protein [Lachnospiraceae bacterium]